MRQLRAIALVVLFSSFVAVRPANAASFGDAVLTVSVATAAGAVLGVSTLPFYEESGEHTKNIFYGAALGAVAGVMIAAFAGVQEGPHDEDEEAQSRKLERDHLAYLSRRITPEPSTARAALSAQARGSVVFWSPLTSIHF